MKRTFLALALFVTSVRVFAAEPTPDEIRRLMGPISPRIQGDILIVEGRIESHIYDYFSMEAAALKKVKVIELNSFGGNLEWAMEIAKKIQGMKVTTRLSAGHFCASACVFLFAAGAQREAAPDIWFGVHGARLGVGNIIQFRELCYHRDDEGQIHYTPENEGCQPFVSDWYERASQATDGAFSFMEQNGVSRSLRETYMEMPDEPNWVERNNVLRKPDWMMTMPEAIQHRLVTVF